MKKIQPSLRPNRSVYLSLFGAGLALALVLGYGQAKNLLAHLLPGGGPDGPTAVQDGASLAFGPNDLMVSVFDDYNSDGTDNGAGEPGISGLTVTAYDAANTPTVFTDSGDGNYLFTPGNANVYRVEITGIDDAFEPSVAGATTTFFMARGQTVAVGLHVPDEYYPGTGVFLTTPCYVDGASNGPNSGGDVLVVVPASGLTTGVGNRTPTEYFVANHNEIGATFGVAYARQAQTLFAAAFTKRHTAFGPGGTGAIYRVGLTSATAPVTAAAPTTFINLNTLFGANTAGANPHPNTADFDRDPLAYDAVGKVGLGGLAFTEENNTLWTINLADRRLYEMPLGGTRSNPTAPSAAAISRWPATGSLVDLPGLPGTPAERAINVRPFAVKAHRGEIYIGVVYTGESTVVLNGANTLVTNTGDRTVMRGYVYKFDPTTDVFTQVLSFPFNYIRGQAIDFCSNNAQAEFFPWAPVYDKNTFQTAVMGNSAVSGSLPPERAYPQPWITDLEFDENGKLLIGVRDRFADQHGFNKLPPTTATADPNLRFSADGAGDILVASPAVSGNGTYVLENNSGNGVGGEPFGPTTGINKQEGPGNGEFFFDDRYRPADATPDGPTRPNCSLDVNDMDPILEPTREQGHDEVSLGGLFQYNGTLNLLLSVYDPINAFDDFNQAGFMSLSTINGSRQGAALVYASLDFNAGTPDNPATFGKGNGLGDVEGVAPAAPLEIGNRVWLDVNNDGIQNPGENGINGVRVELFKDIGGVMTKVAETTTAASATQGDGAFRFSSSPAQTWSNGQTRVLPDMNYEVRVSLANLQSVNGNIIAFATANAGGNATNNNKTDLSDSDANTSGVIAVRTGQPGDNNHTLDIGAVACNIAIASASPGTCVPATNTYTLDVEVTYANIPSGEMIVITTSNGANQSFTPAAASGTETFTLTGLASDGVADIDVTATYSTSTVCTATLADAYDAPADCTPVCSLDITRVDIQCTNGTTFTVSFDVEWDFLNAPSDVIEVSVGGIAQTSINPSAATGIQSFGPISVAGPAYDVLLSAAFQATATCTATSLVDLIACTDPCAGELGGNVFNDFNNDGADAGATEVGQGNVLVEIYECDGATPVATTYTNANGDWSVDDSGFTYPVRVEFSTPLQDYLQPSYAGADNGTDVQFVDAPSCEVDYGVIDISQYCNENPLVAVVCFPRNTDGSAEPIVVFVETNDARNWPGPSIAGDTDGRWGIPAGATAANYPAVAEVFATKVQVETTFGLDWDADNSRLYTGAYMRAFASMGSNSSSNGFAEGAIYEIPIDLANSTSTSAQMWLDLETLLGDGIAGTFIADAVFPGPAAYGVNSLNPNQIGYTGLGSIKVSNDNSELYVVNLATREVLVIPIGPNGAAPTTAAEIKRFPLPTSQCGGTFPDGRPLSAVLGLGVHPESGRVYATLTCTGPTIADVTGHVYSFDPSDATPSAADFNLELTIPLNINRPASSPNSNRFWGQIGHPWETLIPSAVSYNNDPTIGGTAFNPLPRELVSQHIQPWLGEVGFARQNDGTYAMVVGERNRYHDVINGSFYVAGGVFFRACGSEGNWSLESGGSCGSATSSVAYTMSGTRAGQYVSDQNQFFYYVGREGTMGAGTVDIPKGTSEMVIPAMDNLFNSSTSGLSWLSTVDGGRLRDVRILGDFSPGGFNNTNFTKANNWGAIAALCENPPIQIGNYVWEDADEDGVQDACEDPIAGIPVSLYNKATMAFVDVQTTGANGEYYFSDVDPNTEYAIVFGYDYTNMATTGLWDETAGELKVGNIPYALTQADNGEGNSQDLNDSDATLMDMAGLTGYPIISYTTGTETDHTLDVGLVRQPSIEILDPCQCFDVEYDAPETDPLEFLDSIKVTGPAGQTWRVVAQVGMEVVDSFMNRPIPLDTVLREIMPGMYTLNFAHTSRRGYQVTVENNLGQQLTIGAVCNNPAITVTPFNLTPLCNVNTDPVQIVSSARLNGMEVPGTFTYEIIEEHYAETGTPITEIDADAYPDGTILLIRGRYVPSDPQYCPHTFVYEVEILTSACPCENIQDGDDLGGTAFIDQNNDGSMTGDAGQEGVVVRVYDCDGELVCTTVTNENGDWNCQDLNPGEDYRVEFSLPTDGSLANLQPSYAGTDNGTNVQFVQPGTCEVDYGLVDVEEYCNDARILLPCYENGSGVNNSNPVLIQLGYGATGMGANVYPVDAVASTNGSLWGLSYSRKLQMAYTSAFLKRQVGIGERGYDGIYVYDYSNSSVGALVGGFDLEGVVPANGGAAISLGTVTRSLIPSGSGTGDNELSADRNQASRDADAFAKVGKISFGDIDVDEATNTLWVVNLNQRTLLSIDLDQVTPSANVPNTLPSAAVNAYNILGGGTGPTISGAPLCINGELRPFALKIKGGIGYLGAICDASGSATIDGPAEQTAYVLSFDVNNPTSFTEVLSFGLNYPREVSWQPFSPGPGFDPLESDQWQRWMDSWNPAEIKTGIGGLFDGAPQPILSDIEFLEDGSMVLGLMDRFSMQQGWDNLIPTSGSSQLALAVSHGDILLAYHTGLGYVLEGPNVNDVPATLPGGAVSGEKTNDGPSRGGEFFFGDRYVGSDATHPETAMGGLAVLPGSNEVTAVSFDPFAFNSMGVRWLSTATGAQTRAYQILAGGRAAFGKGSALGDVELICDPAPIQIGNYVWIDTDEDGVQDPCETPVAGIPVSLYNKDTDTFVDVQTTGVNGEYYFNDVDPNTNYAIVFGYDHTSTVTDLLWDPVNMEILIDGLPYGLTAADTGEGNSPDLNDSDASLMDMAGLTQYPIISYTTGTETDHTLDAGLISLCIPPSATFVPIPGDCNGIIINNNGRIVLTTTTDADKYGVSAPGAATYDGPDYDAAPAIPVLYADIVTNVPNAGETYIVRIFNGDNGCFTDYPVVVPVANCPIDPQGFIYCEETGEIITGGSISVSGPGTFVITLDGSTGEYQFFTDGTPGIYTITYTPPAGYTLSANRLPAGVLDPTGQPDPFLVGASSADGLVLDDFTAGANPFYLEINFAPGDPEVFTNNIPLQGCSVTLGSTVFEDAENNGVQDATDSGIAGVLVQLFSPGPDGMVGGGDDVEINVGPDGIRGTADDAPGGMPTDANGDYFFQGLAAGDYYVQIGAANFGPAGTLELIPSSSNTTSGTFAGETDPDDNVDNDDEGTQPGGGGTVVTSGIITLSANAEPTDATSETAQGNTQDNTTGNTDDDNGNMTLDFGFFAPVAVGDYAFVDLDMDGTQSAGDEVLPGVVVTLYDSETMLPYAGTDVNGNPITPLTTDANGLYLFSNLPPDDYYVVFNIAGIDNADLYDFAMPNVGGDDALDSDAAPLNASDDTAPSGQTGFLSSGEEDLTLDAGVTCAITVEVSDPFTICSTQPIDLLAGASVAPARLGGAWSTPDGTGTFTDASGTPLTAPYALGTAARYLPSAADARRGFVTLTLTSGDPGLLVPPSSCDPVSASVQIEILKVDCGSFFWNGMD
ncbi:SdrD B-like domain-containing protein [Neolewinella lacunae]|uniref:SD-repeat containing protein B domain-containing protein n=1 Tax=Neolewinella lacunae TaxID=1517758 RepID=A0A923T7X3_9BACT|nr:SdrD B-like domain-containing protein [Neolewinella lacunae]MBC6993971.1 hypothetical protein [Neolewinella lacunae]MDN3635514.1 SdrD B-like domain-containing protein [Neolewinella lacunae]